MRNVPKLAKNQISDIFKKKIELWSFLYSKCGQFSMNFLDDSKKKNRKYFCLFYIRYKTFFNYLEQKIETALFEWRVGGLQIAN